MKYILIWFDQTHIYSLMMSAVHYIDWIMGVMLIHSGRWPLIIFSWADRETKSWCNFWAADWKKLKRNLNAHRPDLLVFLILLKMSWQPLAQTCLGTLLVYQGGKLFRVPKPTPTDMSLWRTSRLRLGVSAKALAKFWRLIGFRQSFLLFTTRKWRSVAFQPWITLGGVNWMEPCESLHPGDSENLYFMGLWRFKQGVKGLQRRRSVIKNNRRKINTHYTHLIMDFWAWNE